MGRFLILNLLWSYCRSLHHGWYSFWVYSRCVIVLVQFCLNAFVYLLAPSSVHTGPAHHLHPFFSSISVFSPVPVSICLCPETLTSRFCVADYLQLYVENALGLRGTQAGELWLLVFIFTVLHDLLFAANLHIFCQFLHYLAASWIRRRCG